MNDMIVGRISKAYATSSIFFPAGPTTAEYLTLFFTDESIIVARYLFFGTLAGAAAGTVIGKEKKKLEKPFISKNEILSEAKHASEIHKDRIEEITLKKQMTDVALEIEFKSKNGSRKKKENIIRFEFSKKEYNNAEYLLDTYFSDKLKKIN